MEEAAEENIELIRINEVIRIIPLSKSNIYSMIKTGAFPKPINIGGRSVAWNRKDIKQWIEQKIQERDRALSMGIN